MTVVLVRHGRSTANVAGILAGRLAGVDLDSLGKEQAEDIAIRCSGTPLAQIVSSPMERCQTTLNPLAQLRNQTIVVDPELIEVDYGAWTGKKIFDLMDEPLWKIVQSTPSQVSFPHGEALADMSHRVVQAIRKRDMEITQIHGAHAIWLACTHGDIIKAIIADALGMHLDLFQRIIVSPASLSIIRYSGKRSTVECINNTSGQISVKVSTTRNESTVGGDMGIEEHARRMIS